MKVKCRLLQGVAETEETRRFRARRGEMSEEGFVLLEAFGSSLNSCLLSLFLLYKDERITSLSAFVTKTREPRMLQKTEKRFCAKVFGNIARR